jgi:hypothetical protein
MNKSKWNKKLQDVLTEQRAIQERMFDGAPPPPIPDEETKAKS